MKIKDLKPRENASIEADVKEIQETREVLTKYGKKLTVTNVILEDDTGTVTFTVWGEDIDKLSVGNKIKIEDGWVAEFQGNLQVSLGRNGKMEVV